MIHGIGTDLVDARRVQDILNRHGDRFIRRILTMEEHDDFQQTVRRSYFLAKRFAAKEALAKALGLGMGRDIAFRDVGITHDGRGRPLFCCGPRASQLLAHYGITAAHLSLADDGDYAIACVVLESQPPVTAL